MAVHAIQNQNFTALLHLLPIFYLLAFLMGSLYNGYNKNKNIIF